jgi:hypothetical protein
MRCYYCGGSTTQAAAQYCKRLGLPITCYKCQYKNGTSVYSVHYKENTFENKNNDNDLKL